MKVYIVVDYCDGGDYQSDDLRIIFTTTDLSKAKKIFEEEIKNWESAMTDFDSNKEENYDSNTLLRYECIDFGSDSHRIMKLIEEKL